MIKSFSKLYSDFWINPDNRELMKPGIDVRRALARRFKINRQSIYYWRHRALLPCDIALKICAATKGKVQLCKLRPDLGLELKELEQIILKKYQQNGDNHDVVPIKP